MIMKTKLSNDIGIDWGQYNKDWSKLSTREREVEVSSILDEVIYKLDNILNDNEIIDSRLTPKDCFDSYRNMYRRYFKKNKSA